MSEGLAVPPSHLQESGLLSFCRFCSYSTAYKGNLKTHMLVHTGERKYACNICQKSFSLKEPESGTVTLQTTEMGVAYHHCSYCSYSTPYKTTLKNHLRLHTGERPYSCTTCGKTFIQKANLRRHMLVHEQV
ncbi:unnamed protein product [Larinioides sclopetarius]|uniref:C2H2-type domain-containing protein n=1 Tax=Larinioides sclopetarius TaxID=280406 RepID=A0AAV2AQA6_9ARAC